MELSFFDQVRDVFEGFVGDIDATLHTSSHRRGLKCWFDDAPHEHYEAQLVRVDGETLLEIGFHAEYRSANENDKVLDRLDVGGTAWRDRLGDEVVIGEFLGVENWRRASETWPSPLFDDPVDPADIVDITIDVAARLADYVRVIEPLRRGAAR